MSVAAPFVASRRGNVPFGMAVPRDLIDEWIKQERRKEGQHFLVKRLKQIKRHLDKCFVPNCPVSLLDLPMKEAEFEATIEEAWAVINERDELQELTRKLYDSGMIS